MKKLFLSLATLFLTTTLFATVVTVECNFDIMHAGTRIFPFDVKLPSDMHAYKIMGVTNNRFDMVDVGREVEANVPYYITNSSLRTYSFTGEDVSTNARYTVGLLTGVMTVYFPDEGKWLGYDVGHPGIHDVANFRRGGVDSYECFFTFTEDNPEPVATLSDIQVNGVSIADFDPEVTEYYVELPEGTTDAPIVTVTPTFSTEVVSISQPANPHRRSIIDVASGDQIGWAQKNYVIHFRVAEPSAPTIMDNVPYVDVDGTTKYANNVTVISNGTRALSEGWYTTKDLTVTSALTCTGNVRIIIADGTLLTAYGFADWDTGITYPAIQITGEENSLTIYGQEEQSGTLKAHADGMEGVAAIGGGINENVYNITINGGIIEAYGGGEAAAIGSGAGYGWGDGAVHNIIINGGHVTAVGGTNAAGIGAGNTGRLDIESTNIQINGGVVNASSEDGSGIGGGTQSAVNGIYITGGEVTATGGSRAAGIGAGDDGEISNIIISGGTINAKGGDGAAGIGGGNGYGRSASNITISGGTVTTKGGTYGAGIGCSASGNSVENITISGGTVLAQGGMFGAGIGAGMDPDEPGNPGIASGIFITGGDVKAYGGYGYQWYWDFAHNKDGVMGGSPGIGGNGASNITISGGSVEAVGSFANGEYGLTSAAGIGGGHNGTASNITISGGNVLATGGEGADAIGNGLLSTWNEESSSNIKVSESLLFLADNVEDPSTFIEHNSTTDIASQLVGKRYATTEPRVRNHYAENMDGFYSTFYFSGMPLKLVSEDVTMYTAVLDNSGAETYLRLNELEGTILPAATPVVLRSESGQKAHFAPYYDSTDDVVVPDNDLTGVDVTTAVAANSVYTLAAEDVDGIETLAFYEYEGTVIPAHRAYLQLAAGQSAPHRIGFGSHTATGMENADATAASLKAEKVLRDGQLLIRKNGRLYNVQGALVR